MATSVKWRLKRYGRFIPGTDETTKGEPWKTFEAKKNEPEIILTIVDYGYLMVLHGQQCLETIPLHSASDFLKVHQKSDNLMIRHTIKGASRLIRMQFDGSNKAQAIKECSSAAERLREHVPVGTQDDTLPSNNQPPADDPAPGTQVALITIQVRPLEANLRLPMKDCCPFSVLPSTCWERPR
ncbi:meiotic recombination protein REC114 isoform X2 [Entelurus aequoreus]|uniref:meiotic recombination protein REC114 isoform X2 n=1 Tax=Entelurus aequoreus TaxID=161455 RepID=UPI002B1E5D1A|nr:meiotic recombination protein REC114 isoform X2 [Entelurus aequoreus]